MLKHRVTWTTTVELKIDFESLGQNKKIISVFIKIPEPVRLFVVYKPTCVYMYMCVYE